MTNLTIKTNNHFRPVIYWDELTTKEQEEYEYLTEEGGSFFRYRDWTYFLGDFMRIDDNAPFKGWDGYHSDSFFSGVLVKYSNCGDAVKVGTYYS